MKFLNERIDWIAAGLASIVSFTIYVLTLAPSVTLEHSGSLIVAGDYLGVGRVPGYPLWHLFAFGFTRLFIWISYHGQPNPAWALNLMSAVFGALSCGLVALLVGRAGKQIGADPAPGLAARMVIPVSAALLFAVSPTMWSQAVIAETHTLTCFFVLLILFLLWQWMDSPFLTPALPLGFIIGMSLSQSHILVLMLPVFLAAMFFKDKRLFRDSVLISGLGLGLMALILHLCSSWYLVLGACCSMVLLMGLPLRYLPFGRWVVGMLLALILGLSFYLYLPMASEGNPPMNWGHARTWDGFIHVITRGQYEHLMPLNVIECPGGLLNLAALYGKLLRADFTGPIALLGLVPLLAVVYSKKRLMRRWALPGLSFVMYSLVLLIGANPQEDLQTVFMLRRLLIPSYAIYAVHIGIGMTLILAARRPAKPSSSIPTTICEASEYDKEPSSVENQKYHQLSVEG